MPYAKASSPRVLPSSVQQRIADAHAQHQVIVLATGVFDVLHSEHRRFLEKAKAVGDLLIVGIECDSRARVLKGEGRPHTDEETRLHNLEAWHIADEVFVLPEQFSQPQDYIDLIVAIKPQILAVSSHTLHLDRKQAVMDLVNGKVMVVHQFNPAVSTTKLLQQ